MQSINIHNKFAKLLTKVDQTILCYLNERLRDKEIAMFLLVLFLAWEANNKVISCFGVCQSIAAGFFNFETKDLRSAKSPGTNEKFTLPKKLTQCFIFYGYYVRNELNGANL